MTRRSLAALLLAVATACSSSGTPSTARTTGTLGAPGSPSATHAANAPETVDADGWRPLFDGHSTAGWRGYRRPDVPAGWQVVDGALTRVGEGTDLITIEQFTDFELELEWMIAPGGNSGVMFHVTEDHGAPWETGPEMQVLDNGVHKDGGDPFTSAGSNYALHPPESDETLPPGEWNEARLVVQGSHVEHWLNGDLLLEYELGSDDWLRRVSASKFAAMPDYGKRPRGHIVLQDHGDRVAYRNIRVRVTQ